MRVRAVRLSLRLRLRVRVRKKESIIVRVLSFLLESPEEGVCNCPPWQTVATRAEGRGLTIMCALRIERDPSEPTEDTGECFESALCRQRCCREPRLFGPSPMPRRLILSESTVTPIHDPRSLVFDWCSEEDLLAGWRRPQLRARWGDQPRCIWAWGRGHSFQFSDGSHRARVREWTTTG